MCSLALVVVALLLTPTTAPAQARAVSPGDIVVTEMAAGRVVAIGPDGQDRQLASGLRSPRGVAVLGDGSVLVAETGQNRIVGIGGRFGTGAPEPVVSIPFPEGITVSADGQVFATALQAGEMGRVDVDAGTYTPIARDLEGPGDVAVRGIAMFVTESGPDGRVVSSVGADGQTAEFADGFQQPIGLAFGPGASLFVADLAANQIVRVDREGNTTVFATVQAPVHLAIEPWIAVEGEPFTLVATSAEGVVRFDQTGQRIVDPVGFAALTGTAGIATVPGTGPGGTPGPTVPTTSVSPTTTSGTTPTEAGPTESAPATTRPPRTTTSISEEEGAPSSTSGGILLASVVIIALVVVGGIVFAVFQRPKSGNRSGFEERPLDTNTVALAFGSCAAEEVELAEAEGALASLEVQSESAEKRLTTATDQVVAARARLAEARRAGGAGPTVASTTGRVAVEAPAPPEPARPHPDPEPVAESAPPAPGLRLDDLQLTTAAGKAALDAFLKREIEAEELEEMWRALGEHRAIEVVRSARPSAHPEPVDAEAADPEADDPEPADTDGPVDSVDGEAGTDDAEPAEELDEEAVAAARLAEAEEDVSHAHAEIERLLEREAAARSRIAAARTALDACQDRHRAELDAEAAANAEAATQAAAAARTTGPPGPSAPSTSSAPDDELTDRDGDSAATDATPDRPTGARPAGSGAADEGDGREDDAGDEPEEPPTGPARPSVAAIIPERPPLTPDAATVASLRRPQPAPLATDPTAGTEAALGDDQRGEPAADPATETDPAETDAAPTPPSGLHRRDGLHRGLFDDGHDDDTDRPAAGATFPAPPAPAMPAGDGAGAEDPFVPTATAADDEPTDADPQAAPRPDPDPDPMAPQPERRAGDASDPTLGDLLFRRPSDPDAPADPSGARLDDLVFAWPSSGFQKLPIADGPESEPVEPQPEREPEPEIEPDRDDEPPRDDLDFL